MEDGVKKHEMRRNQRCYGNNPSSPVLSPDWQRTASSRPRRCTRSTSRGALITPCRSRRRPARIRSPAAAWGRAWTAERRGNCRGRWHSAVCTRCWSPSCPATARSPCPLGAAWHSSQTGYRPPAPPWWSCRRAAGSPAAPSSASASAPGCSAVGSPPAGASRSRSLPYCQPLAASLLCPCSVCPVWRLACPCRTRRSAWLWFRACWGCCWSRCWCCSASCCCFSGCLWSLLMSPGGDASGLPCLGRAVE